MFQNPGQYPLNENVENNEKFNFVMTITREDYLEIFRKSNYTVLNGRVVRDQKTTAEGSLQSNGLGVFQSHINRIENIDARLVQKRSKIQFDLNARTRKPKKHLYVNCYCSRDKCKAKYSFHLLEEPSESQSLIDINVERSGVHCHSIQVKTEKKLEIKDERNIVARTNKLASQFCVGKASSNAVCQSACYLNRYERGWRHDLEITDAALKVIPYDCIQYFSSMPSFKLAMQLTQQREILRAIPPQNRIGFIDSSCGLVHIPVKEQILPSCFAPIVNYFLFAKDLKCKNDDTWKSFLVGELVTSDQSKTAFSTFLLTINSEYKNQFMKHMYFRYIVCDYSWMLINSILENLNIESINKYAQAVFELTQAPTQSLVNLYPQRTWVLSCATQTMHRVASATRQSTNDYKQRLLCCYCFGLLMNCRDLSSMQEIFSVFVQVFGSPRWNQHIELATSKLKEYLNKRLGEREQIQQIIKDNDQNWATYFAVEEIDKKSVDSCDSYDLDYIMRRPQAKSEVSFGDREIHTKWKIQEKNEMICYDLKFTSKTIKDESPFTPIFEKIYNDEMKKLTNEDCLPENELYLPWFLTLLIERFLPYCFFWSSLVLRDTDLSRWTSSSNQEFISARKQHVQQLPADYLRITMGLNKRNFEDFKAACDEMDYS